MSNIAGSPAASNESSAEASVFWKVSLRLLPFLFLMYVINLIDRSNISIARLQMVDERKMFDEEAYAFGASIFYAGYFIFEVPSNLILARIGARVWMARIMVSWGLISSAMMFVTGPRSFTALRVLLGFAEAGFFPGIVYYLQEWFPARVRARALAKFMMGGVFASLLGNSISGYILRYMDQVGGLWGWQWVFLLEGLPAVIMGFVTLYFLTDRPSHARWLTPEERDWLIQQIETDRNQLAEQQCYSLRNALLDPRVWLLTAVYFTVAMGENSYSFYIPTFLKSQFPDWESHEIGLLAAAPSLIAIAVMILVCRHSDRSGERRRHVACAAFTAALGWLMIALVAQGWFAVPANYSRWLFFLGVIVTHMSMKTMLPLFWTLPPIFLSGTAVAGGIALINSIANLGGLLGPRIIGRVKTETGSFTAGYYIMSAALLIGGLLVLVVKIRERHETKG
jgi:ACS family tartrate transporter-like MFS transporter